MLWRPDPVTLVGYPVGEVPSVSLLFEIQLNKFTHAMPI